MCERQLWGGKPTGKTDPLRSFRWSASGARAVTRARSATVRSIPAAARHFAWASAALPLRRQPLAPLQVHAAPAGASLSAATKRRIAALASPWASSASRSPAAGRAADPHRRRVESDDSTSCGGAGGHRRRKSADVALKRELTGPPPQAQPAREGVQGVYFTPREVFYGDVVMCIPASARTHVSLVGMDPRICRGTRWSSTRCA